MGWGGYKQPDFSLIYTSSDFREKKNSTLRRQRQADCWVSRPVWPTWSVPGQSELHSETLPISKKTKSKQNKTKQKHATLITKSLSFLFSKVKKNEYLNSMYRNFRAYRWPCFKGKHAMIAHMISKQTLSIC